MNYYLGKPTGLFDYYASTHYTPAYQLQLVATGGAIASNSQLSFSDPVATVSAKDSKATLSISRLHISGTTSIQMIPMGCIVGSNNLSFAMGSINASEFNTSTKVGERAAVPDPCLRAGNQRFDACGGGASEWG